ncbi:hypothetical protein [Streptomyces sp. cmx-18-6]|uniref:hypothetical protein n=1 Tax=Streptomyces sp. cmx-18-6 TaxID=2790930 RepID=UPI00397EADC0
MHRTIIPLLLTALLIPAAAAPATSAPKAKSAYVDTRVRDCKGSGPGCRPGLVVYHWHKRGAKVRGVSWVYASNERVKSGTARWIVKKPGGKWKTGGKWKKAVHKGGFVETTWGRAGHTGPKYPRGTKICAEFRKLTTKACVTLK